MISDPAMLVAELNDPATPQQRLVEIAGSFPEYGPLVAEHPAASVDVLSYLLKYGDDATRKAAARRRARDVAEITTQRAAATVAEPERVVANTECVVGNAERPTPSPQPPAADIDPTSSDNETAKIEPLVLKNPVPAPELSEDFDETRIAVRSSVRRWSISIDGHDDVVFAGTDILIGRKPSTRREVPGAALVTIPDPTRTVSKTHARMILRGEQWVIIDLESTNGVYVETPRGEHQVVSGTEIPVTRAFSLGDLRVSIKPVER